MTIVDTQAVLWLTQDKSKLSATASEVLSEASLQGRLAISAITLSELAMIVIRRRVKIDRSVEAYLDFVEREFRVIPLTAEIALQAHRFSAGYPGDPADRLIGATAVVHSAKLVTSDRAIRASGEVLCVW